MFAERVRVAGAAFPEESGEREAVEPGLAALNAYKDSTVRVGANRAAHTVVLCVSDISLV